MLKRLDHVNLYTTDLDRFVAWYEDVLGLSNGARPPFPFKGAWLYADGFPIVHVTQVEKQRANIEPGIEHFAVTSEGIGTFLDHLETRDVSYRIGIVPEFGIIQVNIHDPDGNHIHIDFPKDEHNILEARQPRS